MRGPCTAPAEWTKIKEHAHQTARQQALTTHNRTQAPEQRVLWVSRPEQPCITGGARGKDFRGTCCSCAVILFLLKFQVLLFTWSEDFPGEQRGLKSMFKKNKNWNFLAHGRFNNYILSMKCTLRELAGHQMGILCCRSVCLELLLRKTSLSLQMEEQTELICSELVHSLVSSIFSSSNLNSSFDCADCRE